jgi:hypothetical protein
MVCKMNTVTYSFFYLFSTYCFSKFNVHIVPEDKRRKLTFFAQIDKEENFY